MIEGYAIADDSRIRKAKKIIVCLEFVMNKKLRNMRLLEIGAGSGLISYELSKHGNEVVAIDIQADTLKKAINNLKIQLTEYINFQIADGINLPFKSNCFDVCICNQVIEHVPKNKQEELINEAYRVLKNKGLFYMATGNKLWPIEPHTGLPFLQYLPQLIADKYIKLFKKIDRYDVSLPTYWKLKMMMYKFNKIIDLTPHIIKNPEKFYIREEIPSHFKLVTKRIPLRILSAISPISPSWILVGVK